MNLGEIQEAVFEFLQIQSNNGHFSPDEVTRHANSGMYRMHQMIAEHFEGFFEVNTTMSETAGQGTYNLPDDLYRLVRLDRLKNDNSSASISPFTIPKIRHNVSDIDRARVIAPQIRASNVQNRVFRMIGQKQIELIPAPVSTQADSLRLYYIFKPAPMSQSTHEPFQQTAGVATSGMDRLEEFHDIIWMYAARFGIAKEEAQLQYQMLDQQMQERFSDLQTYLDHMNAQEPDFIASSDLVHEYFDDY